MSPKGRGQNGRDQLRHFKRAAIVNAKGLNPRAIAVFTDQTYRDEFLTELTSEMRDSFVARAEYLRATGAPPGGAGQTSSP